MGDASRRARYLIKISCMPRGPRVDFAGAVHHVYGRGNEKRDIFIDDRDRLVFCERIGTNLSRWGVRCIAWSLMPNHYHLLVISDDGELPFFMRCLLTAFSMHFNNKYERVGHLFQNRYQTRLIAKETHLREAVRYIHLNPLRAGLVGSLKELESYPWTGHRQILRGGTACWQDLQSLREIFVGDQESSWTARYLEFVRAGSRVAGHEGAYGDSAASPVAEADKYPGNASRGDAGPPEEFLRVVAQISARTGIPAERILGPGRLRHEVGARRDVLRNCKTEMTDASTAQICRWLGISEAAGGYLLRSGKPGARNSQDRPRS